MIETVNQLKPLIVDKSILLKFFNIGQKFASILTVKTIVHNCILLIKQ